MTNNWIVQLEDCDIQEALRHLPWRLLLCPIKTWIWEEQLHANPANDILSKSVQQER